MANQKEPKVSILWQRLKSELFAYQRRPSMRGAAVINGLVARLDQRLSRLEN